MHTRLCLAALADMWLSAIGDACCGLVGVWFAGVRRSMRRSFKPGCVGQPAFRHRRRLVGGATTVRLPVNSEEHQEVPTSAIGVELLST